MNVDVLQLQLLPEDVQKNILVKITADGVHDSGQLRICSKYWRRLHDEKQTCATFEPDMVAEVMSFLNRLPRLDSVIFKGSFTHENFVQGESLASLAADLKDVKLNFVRTLNAPPEDNQPHMHPADSVQRMIVVNPGALLLSWSHSLQSLHLDNCTLANSDYKVLGSLDFISKLPLLSALSLSKLQVKHDCPTQLDLAGCPALRTLRCIECQLSLLDITCCKLLTSVVCSENSLQSLDVSACVSLQILDCVGNQLDHLDVSACADLKELWCSSNRLKDIRFADQAKVDTLQCHDDRYTRTPLGSIQLFGLAAVSDLVCSMADLDSMPPMMVSKLRSVTLRGQGVVGGLSGFKELRRFCSSCIDYDSLDFSGCTAVELDLTCIAYQYGRGEITLDSLILGKDAVSSLILGDGTSIAKFTDFTALESLHYTIGGHETVDLSNCKNLRTITITVGDEVADCGSRLVSVDLTGCSGLQMLAIYGHPSLAELDVTSCTDLRELRYSRSSLRRLDVSCCPLLSHLDVSGSKMLMELCTAGCERLTCFKISRCPRLPGECIQVRIWHTYLFAHV